MLVHAKHTAECLGDIKKLYQKRNPLFRLAYLLMGIVSVGVSVYTLPVYFEELGISLIIILIVGIILIFSALWIEKAYWVFWKKQFSSLASNSMEYLVDDTGVRIGERGTVIEWPHFVSSKASLNVLLMYVNRFTAIPIHKTWLSTEDEWDELNKLIKAKVERKWWL